jgi:hypothetical protein
MLVIIGEFMKNSFLKPIIYKQKEKLGVLNDLTGK